MITHTTRGIKVNKQLKITENKTHLKFVLEKDANLYKVYDEFEHKFNELCFFVDYFVLGETCTLIIEGNNCKIYGVIPNNVDIINNGTDNIIDVDTEYIHAIKRLLVDYDNYLTQLFKKKKVMSTYMIGQGISPMKFNKVWHLYEKQSTTILSFISTYVNGDSEVVKLGILTKILAELQLDSEDLSGSLVELKQTKELQVDAVLILYGILSTVFEDIL